MTIDLGFLLGKNYINNDGSQNYLIFQLIFIFPQYQLVDTETVKSEKYLNSTMKITKKDCKK